MDILTEMKKSKKCVGVQVVSQSRTKEVGVTETSWLYSVPSASNNGPRSCVYLETLTLCAMCSSSNDSLIVQHLNINGIKSLESLLEHDMLYSLFKQHSEYTPTSHLSGAQVSPQK